MRYVKTNKVEHSLELNGSELQEFLRGELRVAGELLEPPEEEVDKINAIIPRGGDYSGMSIPVAELQFHVEWMEESEEVEES